MTCPSGDKEGNAYDFMRFVIQLDLVLKKLISNLQEKF
jgi:hypothetical protein